MIRTDEYLEPLKYYESSLKNIHHDNVEEYFNELTQQSGVDVDANQVTCNKLYKERENLKKVQKKMTGIIVLEVFLIIFAIIGIGAGVFLIIQNQSNPGLFIPLGIGAIILGIGLFLLVILVLRKKRKSAKQEIERLEETCRQLEQEAWAQMAPLNNSFNELMAPHLFTKSAPLIQIDDNLTSLTEERIAEQFECPLDRDTTRSALVVQSGNVNTNPFIFKQVLTMKMLPEVYTGTLVITYTRTVSDGNGGTRTVTEHQTLVAHVTRPKPHYAVETSLNFYTDVASRLSFSRTPAGLEGKSDKEIERIANRKDKEETKKADKALKEGKNYTKFANSKFESYLNAEGRDHEIDYRTMFTPLAQTNYMYNFSKKDDIYYTKIKCQNIIQSNHDIDKDYSGSPLNYYSYDYEVIKKKFMDYNENFFEGLYMDFVPLLSIPVFHETQSEPYIPNPSRVDRLSMYEGEVMANRFDPKLFKPVGCDTDVILKVETTPTSLNVSSYGYHADPRTEMVPVMGNDGRSHLVPVNYYEYLPVEMLKFVKVFNNDGNTLDNNNDNGINYKKYKVEII